MLELASPKFITQKKTHTNPALSDIIYASKICCEFCSFITEGLK